MGTVGVVGVAGDAAATATAEAEAAAAAEADVYSSASHTPYPFSPPPPSSPPPPPPPLSSSSLYDIPSPSAAPGIPHQPYSRCRPRLLPSSAVPLPRPPHQQHSHPSYKAHSDSKSPA